MRSEKKTTNGVWRKKIKKNNNKYIFQAWSQLEKPHNHRKMNETTVRYNAKET